MFSRISNTLIGSPGFYLGLSIILIAFGGIIDATADIEANKAIVLRGWDEVFNQGNLAAADEIFAADYVLHLPGQPEQYGPESIKAAVTMQRTGLPDLHYTIEDLIAEGDKVAVRYTALGTHQGEFMSIPLTGKQITITGITIHRFADGKFVESWFSYDMLGFMQQLTAPPPVPEGFVVDQITSPSLEGNLLGDSATRRMTIYLPPGYDTSDKRYPVVYLLHGVPLGETAYLIEQNRLNWVGVFFSAGPDFPENGFNGMLDDDLIATGELKEMIIVMPDATSKYSLSFYTNSELSGNYEDYIANDLVSYIDSHYRTIPSRDSRAIVGHCEGGYGAMKLAMKHPGVFGAVASHSTPLSLVEWFKSYVPAVMAENPDGMTGPSLEKTATSLVYAMSAAFSPNLNNPPFFVDLPFEYPSGEIVDEVWNRWLEHDPLTMLNTYGGNLASLRGVYIDCGNQDEIGVTPHVEAFHQALDAAGIEHEYEIYDGTHCSKLYSRLAISLSFLSDALVAEEELEDYTNVFFTSLSAGLNMVSLPLKPQTPYTARSFAETLSATTVIKLDEARQRFVGFTLDAPDDGFAIEGGKGYIVNVPESRTVAFTGAPWTNQPLVEAAPAAQSDGAWAFVVSGKFENDSNDSLKRDGYLVTVRNTRTNAVATDVVRVGTPTTHENDSERAILAALEMREAVRKLNLNISIGINTGMVYVGAMGPNEHREFTAMGTAVNLAARLEGVAQPGQILVGESTYRPTRRAFAFNPLLPLTLRGITEPVSAYEVLEVLPQPEKLRGIEGLRTEMIGREKEFADLKERVDDLLVGRGQIVSIIIPWTSACAKWGR